MNVTDNDQSSAVNYINSYDTQCLRPTTFLIFIKDFPFFREYDADHTTTYIKLVTLDNQRADTEFSSLAINVSSLSEVNYFERKLGTKLIFQTFK